MAVTKKDIIVQVSEKMSIPQRTAQSMVDAVFDIMRAELAKEDVTSSVTVRGFGTFKVVKSAKRSGRNLQTGERVEIPPKYRVKFSSYIDQDKE